MSIHPEDANSYADQLHRDLAAMTAAVERIAELLALSLDEERGFRVNGIADVAGEPGTRAWMRRENIAVEALQAMFASVSRQWIASDQDEDTVIYLCGQSFRLGWESHKAAS